MYEFKQVTLEGRKIAEEDPTDRFPVFASIEIHSSKENEGFWDPSVFGGAIESLL